MIFFRTKMFLFRKHCET